MATPIWHDYNIDLGTGDSYLYRVMITTKSATRKQIYQGRAYKRPGDSSTNIIFNSICADFLSQVATMPQADFLQLSFPITFEVDTSIDNGTTWAEDEDEAEFLNDWSYDISYDAEKMGMSFPINGHIDSRQWIPVSAPSGTSLSVKVYTTTGSSSTATKTLSIADNFCNNTKSKDADIYRLMTAAGAGTLVFNLDDYTNVDHVLIGGKSTYKVVTSCAKYALLYINAYGGWDSFLIEGNTKESTNITRYTTERQGNNTPLSANILNPNSVNYVNEIERSFTFVTGWLTDDESSRMHHLLNSPHVYLYDIDNNSKTPVILSTDTHEKKTYRGNGCSLVNYEITAKVATDTIRR